VASSVVVVIVMVAADLGDPSTGAMTASAQRAIGPDATIVVRGVDVLPADGEAVALETSLRAEAVIEVSWPGSAHDRVHLRVHVRAKEPAWADRDLVFQPSDVPIERGRTIGFAIGSMVPVRAKEEPPPTPVPVPVEPLPSPEKAPPPPAAPTMPPSPPTPVGTSKEVLPPSLPPASPPSPSSHRFGFDLAALGSLGIGGFAGGLGGELGGRFWLTPAIAAVARGSATRGDIEIAQATATTLRFAAGLSIDLLPLLPSASTRTFAVDVDATLGVSRLALSRNAVGEQASAGNRWVSVVQLRAEAVWWFLPQTALVPSLGVELAFGPTEVHVDGAAVATIPWSRGIAALGLRTRF
jgi:hypothetical protein